MLARKGADRSLRWVVLALLTVTAAALGAPLSFAAPAGAAITGKGPETTPTTAPNLGRAPAPAQTPRAAAAPAATTACPNGTTVTTAAHEDDSLLFESPDIVHDVQDGRCLRSIFVTAGDAGLDQTYWSSREKGTEAGYASMAGVSNAWTQADAGVPGHPMPLVTLAGNPRVSLVFMRLPDGAPDGSGFPLYGSRASSS